jgi:hypothetical protein
MNRVIESLIADRDPIVENALINKEALEFSRLLRYDIG